MCFALALWNGHDPILKERLFGLTGPEGNHGEDVKELYYYLDATPTSSYLKALYKYPQNAFPYAQLVDENRRRSRHDPEFEVLDTGVFDGDRYFDVVAEYAKASPNDVLIRITVANRGPAPATLHLLPTLWLRNTWSWGRDGQEAYWPRGRITRRDATTLAAEHVSLGTFRLAVEPIAEARRPRSCSRRTRPTSPGSMAPPNPIPYVKDAFHRHLIDGEAGAINPAETGTKAAAHLQLALPPGGAACVRLRLVCEAEAQPQPFGSDFDDVFAARIAEADAFYDAISPPLATDAERHVLRQAYAGLLWTKQFYRYDVATWLAGDPSQPPPPESRRHGRNADWPHLYNRDVISMPDKWEYPWYAAWDLAFHMIPFARIDPDFAKEQLVLFLREWYMHPNGQLPAYEFAFGDVNPPVHAWAAWRVYKMTAAARAARSDLPRPRVPEVRPQLHLVGQSQGRRRPQSLRWRLPRARQHRRLRSLAPAAERRTPRAGRRHRLDGLLLRDDALDGTRAGEEGPVLRGHGLEVLRALHRHRRRHEHARRHRAVGRGGRLLLRPPARRRPRRSRCGSARSSGSSRSSRSRCSSRTRSIACPRSRKRMQWFLDNRRDLVPQMAYMHPRRRPQAARHSRARAPRTPAAVHARRERVPVAARHPLAVARAPQPAVSLLAQDGQSLDVGYMPAESTLGIFGGNSNWRGPVWFPLNYLLIEALERYHHFYGDDLLVELPTGSGRRVSLLDAAYELRRRLLTLFLADATGRRPCHGDERRYAEDPHYRDLVLFYEYFDGDTGRGCGASHQTGWTALIAPSIQELARARNAPR